MELLQSLVEDWESRAALSDLCADQVEERDPMYVTYAVEAATMRRAARELRTAMGT